MDSKTAARLIELNRDFYTRFGESFSATRHRVQPGVRRVLEMLEGDESILDLGCGNGEFARELAKRGHRGPYLGVDFSLPLLQEADSPPVSFSARYLQADVTSNSLIDVIARSRWSSSSEQSEERIETKTTTLAPDASAGEQSPTGEEIASSGYRPSRNDMFDIVFCFAVLHHIPSSELRLNILQTVRQLLKDDGRFIHSNWQFLNSEKLKARIQSWETAAISESDVDAGDYLLDWRSGGEGLRYVHHFNKDELNELAQASRFHISNMFYSDGVGGRLGLYQVWVPDSDKNM